MEHKYIKIELVGGGSYIQPMEKLADAIDGETDGLNIGETITLKLTPVSMSDEEYNRLPDFGGH